MDRLGFDGVGLNEHHTTPHGMMNSPNMMAAAAAQRTKKLKFLILGNLLPLHNPLRIAEELAMADCMSRGRILSGFARGVPREYNVYDVSMAESRARFEEAVDIILKAWTEPQFSHDGKFWSYKDIAIWPRPYQQPHPPVWVPFTGSKETIEWAGKHNFSAVMPDYQARADRRTSSAISPSSSRRTATRITPEHLCFFTDAYVATDKRRGAQGIQPVLSLFRAHALAPRLAGEGVVAEGHRLSVVVVVRLHQAGEPRRRRRRPREDEDDDAGRRREARSTTGSWPGASPKDVADRLIDGAERYGRQFAAAEHERRRHAVRGVPGADPALRQRRAAEAAGASGQAGAGGGDGALRTAPVRTRAQAATRSVDPGDCTRDYEPLRKPRLESPPADSA